MLGFSLYGYIFVIIAGLVADYIATVQHMNKEDAKIYNNHDLI